mmetsp:Transcript_12393/g.32390  ORF Transcript_12393/g.32390 Transcript_12393/m.32390 type:complete len:205 (-) Transcript_12393:810-1424(-)
MARRVVHERDEHLDRQGRRHHRQARTRDRALLIERAVARAIDRRDHVVTEVAPQPLGALRAWLGDRCDVLVVVHSRDGAFDTAARAAAVAHDHVRVEAERSGDGRLVACGAKERGKPPRLTRVGEQEHGVVRVDQRLELVHGGAHAVHLGVRGRVAGHRHVQLDALGTRAREDGGDRLRRGDCLGPALRARTVVVGEEALPHGV